MKRHREERRQGTPGLTVRRNQCASCIYRPDSPLDLEKLERQVRDRWVGFKGYRACHQHDREKVCCRGFWDRHSDEFPGGQLATRLNCVYIVDANGRIEHWPQPSERVRVNLTASSGTGLIKTGPGEQHGEETKKRLHHSDRNP